jgi:4-amino-4-deoxy-L-arabinose transferase-like glycosyltransferase
MIKLPEFPFWKPTLIGILILGALLRLWQLGYIPAGITHDEMGYIYNAYSIAQTGKNVFGETLPFFTWMTRGGFPFMPVPIYSMVPLFWLLPLTPFVGRLLPAVLGVLDCLLLFLIVRRLFSNTALALLSSLFLAVSPWHLHFARSAYDANYSLFYFLLGILAFYGKPKEVRFPWLAVVSFILAVFSYRGMSIIFLPLGITLLWHATVSRSVTPQRIRGFAGGLAVCTLLFVAAALFAGKGYTAEGAVLFDNPQMQADIDARIREAQGPLTIRRFFTNKPTYIIDRIRENYLKAYSPEFLFLYTEPSAIYSIWSRGRIYFIDCVFIILGLIYLLRGNRKSTLLWIAFLLIGGLPGGIGGMPYSSRNFFLAAIFPVFSAAGVLFAVSFFRNERIRRLTILIIFGLYTYALGSYLYDYYGRYAWYGAEAWAKSIKEISMLAHTKKTEVDMVFLGKTSFADAVEYAFWNRIDPMLVQKSWQDKQTTPFVHYPVGPVLFSEKCLDQQDMATPLMMEPKTILYITTHTCNNTATPSAKIHDYYGNPLWKIFDLDTRRPKTIEAL